MFKKTIVSSLSAILIVVALIIPVQANGYYPNPPTYGGTYTDFCYPAKGIDLVISYSGGTCLFKRTQGAPALQVESISNFPTVPNSWIVTQSTSSGKVVIHAGGAPYATQIWGTLDSPTPTGWIISDDTSTNKQLTNLNGASSGAELGVKKVASSLPMGWFTAGSYPNGYVKIKKLY